MTGIGFSSSTAVFRSHYFSNNAPYSSSSSALLFAEGQMAEVCGPCNTLDILSDVGEHQERMRSFVTDLKVLMYNERRAYSSGRRRKWKS